MSELIERLRDEWLRKATSSFTCQECGIQANFIDEIENALDAKDKQIAELEAGGWQPIETAPKDGTHILAVLHRGACEDMDGIRHKAFSEVREIWYRSYTQFGMFLPWHAGDPFGSHEGIAPEHMGEGVPILWQPLPAPPSSPKAEADE